MNEKIQQLESRIQTLESQNLLRIQDENPHRINLADIFSVSPSQTVNDPFWNFMMWGKIALSGGNATLTDSRIKSTSTVVTGQQTVASTDLVSVNPGSGSCAFGSNGSASFNVYYLIIF